MTPWTKCLECPRNTTWCTSFWFAMEAQSRSWTFGTFIVSVTIANQNLVCFLNGHQKSMKGGQEQRTSEGGWIITASQILSAMLWERSIVSSMLANVLVLNLKTSINLPSKHQTVKAWPMKKHWLGKTAWIYLQSYFTKAVKEHARPGMLTAAEQNQGVYIFKRGMLASLYHSLILEDDEKRHQYCPPESWCSYKRSKQMENKNHYLDSRRCFRTNFVACL